MDLWYVSDRFTFCDIFTLILILFLTSKLLKTSLSCSGTLWSTRVELSRNELWGLARIYLKSIFLQISSHEIQNSSRGVKTTFRFGEYSVSRSPRRKLKLCFTYINFDFNFVRKKLYARCKLKCSLKNSLFEMQSERFDHTIQASDCQ